LSFWPGLPPYISCSNSDLASATASGVALQLLKTSVRGTANLLPAILLKMVGLP